jgi:hypothetical protein
MGLVKRNEGHEAIGRARVRVGVEIRDWSGKGALLIQGREIGRARHVIIIAYLAIPSNAAHH